MSQHSPSREKSSARQEPGSARQLRDPQRVVAACALSLCQKAAGVSEGMIAHCRMHVCVHGLHAHLGGN